MADGFFEVDAALLQELGERLIGRPHIALAELAKNSYDADANTCRVIFGEDSIEVIDDGHGMDLAEFRRFWLRLGTQHKREEGTSRLLGRPFTGSKGIGRLAVQFLAKRLDLWTTGESRGAGTFHAHVDWERVRAGGSLRTVPVRIQRVGPDRRPQYPNRHRHGTRIVLSGLRKTDWNEQDLEELGRELWALRSPFAALRGQRGRRDDPYWFDVEVEAPGIEDARESFDARLRALTAEVWRARITGRVRDGRNGDRATLSVEFDKGYPDGAPAQTYSDRVKLSELRLLDGEPGPGRPLLDHADFTIYVYKLAGKQPSGFTVGDLRDYLDTYGNVSVYDAGFRLPYYGADNDWLDVGQDYSRRMSRSRVLMPKWNIEARYMLDLPEPRRLFGAVEISTNREAAAEGVGAAPGDWLQITSGRDRLHSNLAYEQLRSLIRYSMDLYANRYAARQVRQVEQRRSVEPASARFSRVRGLLRKYRKVVPDDVFEQLDAEVQGAEQAAASVEEVFQARTGLLAPLAAAGMTALGMTHEFARETRVLQQARRRLVVLAKRYKLPDIVEAADEIAAAAARISSMQSLFSPLLTPEDREGDERLLVASIVRQVTDSMAPLVPGLAIAVEVPRDLRFPPGPLASWSAVVQNVLANAWNAVLDAAEARVTFSGRREGGDEELVISDTGVGLGIPIADASQLFEPFERRLEIDPSRRSIAIGGQGLGLAIVRMICERHGVAVEFVAPRPGFSTSVRMRWKA